MCKRCCYVNNRTRYTKEWRNARAREWRRKNPGKAKIQAARIRARRKAEGYPQKYNKIHAETIKAQKAVYYVTNKERINSRNNAYYAEHREARLERMRAHYVEDYAIRPDWWKAKDQKRRARKKLTKGDIGEEEFAVVRARSAGYCPYCGELLENGGEFDHLVPLSRKELAPEHSADNLVFCCQRCNRSKQDKTDVEFMIWRASNGIIGTRSHS